MKLRQSREFHMAPDQTLIPDADFVQVRMEKDSNATGLDNTAGNSTSGSNDNTVGNDEEAAGQVDDLAFEEDLKADTRVVAGLLDIVCICWM